MMEVGSRAGYYTSKSPKMILHEWCNRANLPKPRYKAIPMEDGCFRCKVLAPLLARPSGIGRRSLSLVVSRLSDYPRDMHLI
jgi:hypothetical protein